MVKTSKRNEFACKIQTMQYITYQIPTIGGTKELDPLYSLSSFFLEAWNRLRRNG